MRMIGNKGEAWAEGIGLLILMVIAIFVAIVSR